MAMIKCPECRKKISDRAKICPNCGYPISEREGRRNVEGRTFEELPSRSKRAMPLILFVVGLIIASSLSEKNADTPNKETVSTLSFKEQFMLDSSADLDNTLAKSIYNTLLNMGFEEIKYEEKRDSSYVVSTKINNQEMKNRYVITVDVVNENITTIKIGASLLYDSGKILMNHDQLEARYISNSDKHIYIAHAKNAIEKAALAPSTIDYIDNSFKVYKNYNYVVVSCELDAANAFNTPIRSEVIVELRIEGTGDNITAYCEYLKWGDKEVGTYIDLDSINVE